MLDRDGTGWSLSVVTGHIYAPVLGGVPPLRPLAELHQLRPQPGLLPRVSQSDPGDGEGLSGMT